MIEILTLFLGMVSGPQTVSLAVPEATAVVEIQLDGTTVTQRQAPPWTVEVDLGSELSPHELVAIARDVDGVELGRSRRWINLETPMADARLELVGEGEAPQAVLLRWEGVDRRQVEGFEVTLDGEPLPSGLDSAGRLGARLPEVDLRAPHVLAALVRFGAGQERQLTVAFGGRLGLTLDTELTAVVVALERGSTLPPAEKLDGWFESSSGPVEAHGVETGTGDVVVVRSESVQAWLDARADEAVAWGRRLRGSRSLGPRSGPFRSASVFRQPDTMLRQLGPDLAVALQTLAAATPLGTDDHLRFVSTNAAPLVARGVHPGMFATSETLDGAQGGLLRLASQKLGTDFPDQTADAVALAGMLAHAEHGRRAVVLLLEGPEATPDGSLYAPEQVRRYLRQLGVPLEVWALTGPSQGFDHPGWGPVHVLDGARGPLRALDQAVDDLRRRLSRQRVVWLVGTHLPGSLRLGAKAWGIHWPE